MSTINRIKTDGVTVFLRDTFFCKYIKGSAHQPISRRLPAERQFYTAHPYELKFGKL